MSYSQQANSPSSRPFQQQHQSRNQFYTRTYYSLDEDESQLEPTIRSAVKKCSVGTSTSGGYVGAQSHHQLQASPHYRDSSSSPQPTTSVTSYTHHYSPRLTAAGTTTTIDSDSHHITNSPLSDALLLALRRHSRASTRFVSE